MSDYSIIINTAAAQLLPDAGILSLQLHYVANGVDALTISQRHATLSTISPPYAYGDVVRLFYGATCVFVGTIEVLPSQSDPSSTTGVYVAKGPTHDLQRCDYSQAWSYRDANGNLQQDYDPNVCLCDNNGTRISTGQQIAQVVDYAATRGLIITTGTINAGLLAPFDQKSNISCWDAIIAMLRYTPNQVVWWDYNNQIAGAYVPALNVTAAADMPTATLAHNDTNDINITPRHDLVVPGIQVIFAYTAKIDGATYRTRTTQTAGNLDHPRRLSLLYPLEGAQSVTQKQPIEVNPYPAFGVNAATKSWAHANVLWLRRLIYTDWDVQSVSRPGSLPNQLIGGTPAQWLSNKLDFETEEITVKIKYTVKDDNNQPIRTEIKDITIKVTSTDAITKTYIRQESYQAPEPEPDNFAADLYSAWSTLYYNGSVGHKQQTPTPTIRPGHTLNITGALAEWATMAAVIQDTTINWPSGQISHNIGPCPRLEADNLMAIFRGIRGRRYSSERLTRNDPDKTDDIWGPISDPPSSISDGAPADKVEQLVIQSANKRIAINPANIEQSAPQTMLARKMLLPTSQSTAQTAYVMATANYGEVVRTDVIPEGYEEQILNLVTDAGIITRTILVRSDNKSNVRTWTTTDDVYKLLQVGGGDKLVLDYGRYAY